MKEELYNLLYEWHVREWDCRHCQHMTTYRPDDGMHPCNRCHGFNLFKIANHIDADLKDKVKEIIKIVRKEK